ncbi:MAG: putative Ig domain-containing protein [Acidobacteria bacterium]|nr:putative Ig domain-containing protein [Acidobacteriota bacterium]
MSNRRWWIGGLVMVLCAGLSATLSAQVPLTIASASPLPPGEVSTPYGFTFTATGGTPPYQNWSVVPPSTLPPGLTLNPATGLLSGTPTAASPTYPSPGFFFQVQVRDSAPTPATATMAFNLVIQMVIATPSPLPNGRIGSPYSVTLTAAGGQAPYSWLLVQSFLPPGLSLNGFTGTISGTPQAAGNYSFNVQVQDNQIMIPRTVSKLFRFIIDPRLPPDITTPSSLPEGQVDQSYNLTFIATGGVPPYFGWTVIEGTLPPGLSLDSFSGTISGRPTSPGTFTVMVQVSDSDFPPNLLSKQFTLVITSPPLSIITGQLGNGRAGSNYSDTLRATGGQSPYAWTLISGALPPGLVLNAASGQLSGMVYGLGTFAFGVQVADARQARASKDFTITIEPPTNLVVTINRCTDPDSSTADPAQQFRICAALSQPFSVPLTGRVTLTFTPNADNPSDDPAIQFSSGGRTLDFSIPTGDLQARFSSGDPSLQTGTTAGSITLSTVLQIGGTPFVPPNASRTITVNRSAPKITGVSIGSRSGNSFEVVITGYSTTRALRQVTLRFTSRPGSELPTSSFSLDLGPAAGAWYQSAASQPFGSRLVVVIPFSVQGDMSGLGSVAVSLISSEGPSSEVSANF